MKKRRVTFLMMLMLCSVSPAGEGGKRGHGSSLLNAKEMCQAIKMGVAHELFPAFRKYGRSRGMKDSEIARDWVESVDQLNADDDLSQELLSEIMAATGAKDALPEGARPSYAYGQELDQKMESAFVERYAGKFGRMYLDKDRFGDPEYWMDVADKSGEDDEDEDGGEMREKLLSVSRENSTRRSGEPTEGGSGHGGDSLKDKVAGRLVKNEDGTTNGFGRFIQKMDSFKKSFPNKMFGDKESKEAAHE